MTSEASAIEPTLASKLDPTVYVLAAVVAGIAIGLASGGRLQGIGEADLRWLPLLYASAVLQIAAIPLDGAPGLAAVLLSFAGLVAFAAANFHHAGMGVVLVGVAMNFVVIAVNGGMPVRPDAIVAAGIAERSELRGLDFTAKRHLERDDDKLLALADIIPVPAGPLSQVLSFGDLVMSVGVADLIVHLMRRPKRGSAGAAASAAVSQPSPEASASPDSG
jgi:hypothetical protein